MNSDGLREQLGNGIIFLVIFRTIFLNNTGAWSQNNAQLRDPVSGLDANPVLLNPLDAAGLGIADGETVNV